MCKKKIWFDIGNDEHYIRDHTTMPPVSLPRAEMEKPAAAAGLTQMTIRVPALAHWDVHVARPAGIRCIDVYHAIWETFNTVLSPVECERWIPRDPAARKRWDEHWHRRCRASPGLSEVERRNGKRRVDLLEGRRIFMGLRRPLEEDGKPDSYWVLELGVPNDPPR